jgi:hypothetical protein
VADFVIPSLAGGLNDSVTSRDPKPCTKCRVEQPLSSFYFNTHRKIYNSWCRKCHSDDARVRRKAWTPEQNSAYLRRQNLKHGYGITVEQYDEMFRSQGGLCAICGFPETAKRSTGRTTNLAVDHDELTGRIRGLLCGRCNTGIGLLRHDKARLRAAIDYLQRATWRIS